MKTNFSLKNIGSEIKEMTSMKSGLMLEKHNLKTSYNRIVGNVNKVICNINSLEDQVEKLVNYNNTE